MKSTRTKKIIIFLSVFIFIAGFAFAFYAFLWPKQKNPVHIPFLKTNSRWVDSLQKVMTIDEKIGLFFLYDAGRIEDEDLSDIISMSKKKQIGGIIFSTDSLKQQIQYTNLIQANSKIQLFIGLNASYCFPDFIKDLRPFADGFPLEVIADDSLLKDYAVTVSVLNKALGTNLLFCHDFSKKEYQSRDSLWLSKLTKKYLYLIQQAQAMNILSVVTGFGKTKDTLVQKALNATYRKLIQSEISGISSDADFLIKVKNKESGIFHYFRNNLHYDGLLVRKINADEKQFDDEIFKALSGEPDLILTNGNIENISKKIKNSIAEKDIDINVLDKKVRRILLAKSWTGMEKFKPLSVDSVFAVMNSVHSKSLAMRMKEASIVLVKNDLKKIPVQNIVQELSIYSFRQAQYNAFCDSGYDAFVKQFEFYADCKIKQINSDLPQFFKELAGSQSGSVIIFDSIPKKYVKEFAGAINKIANKSNIILVNFGKPENLIPVEKMPTLIQVYNKSNEMQSLTAQLIFGGISAKGKLPVKISSILKFETGIINTPVTRLAYTIPEEAGIDSEMLTEIDDIANEAIAEHGTPGCQVFVAKDGKVIYNKCFGNHTYERSEPVTWNDLYDIASITKVAATTLAVMKMYEKKKLFLDLKIGRYFSDTSIDYTRIKPDTLVRIDTFNVSEIINNNELIADKDTVYIDDSTLVAYDTIISKVTPKLNIFQTALKDLMIHKSGLPPSMPVLRYVQYRKDKIFLNEQPLKTRKDTSQYLFNKFYSRKFIKDSAEVEIADNFYLRKTYVDTLWNDIKQIKVYSKLVYMYSDVNMNLVQKVVDAINDYSIDKFLDEAFYRPLGLRYTCYKPRARFDKKHIIPTSEDKFWREQLLQGDVHDPAAAMLGGVAGNAGLFSCANDLGVLFQMLLNKGIYGGARYLDSTTVIKFTSRQPDSYRGLGFDMASEKGINATDASSETFGHTGFTGTCVWADPKNKLVYVFLSNRVCPSEKNWKLNSLEVRQKIHQVIYDAIKNSKGCR